jgi:hypothetical protein
MRAHIDAIDASSKTCEVNRSHTWGARLCQEASTTCFRLHAFDLLSSAGQSSQEKARRRPGEGPDVCPSPDQT